MGLHDEFKGKEFGKKSADKYAKHLAALVAFNQSKFFGKGEHWFRPLCEELGVAVSGNFVSKGYIVSLFVVCADSKLFVKSTENIEGSWGKSKNRDKVGKAFVEAVKEAEQNGNVHYPDTLKLFKFLFPWILN